MNSVERTVAEAEASLDQIEDLNMRSLAKTLFASEGSKSSGPASRIRAMRSSFLLPRIMREGLRNMFEASPQALSVFCAAINMAHKAVNAPKLTEKRVLDSLQIIHTKAKNFHTTSTS